MRLFLVTVFTVGSCFVSFAEAQENPGHFHPRECSRVATVSDVVNCARLAHPEVRLARQQLEIVAARRLGAGVWLPSNPIVTLGFGRRRTLESDPVATDQNWSITLFQEFEIAGQRGVRLEALDAEAQVHVRRIAVAEQESAAQALEVYFTAMGAVERIALTAELVRIADALSEAASAGEQVFLLSGLDADVAKIEATRIRLLHFESEQELARTRRALALMLGVDFGSLEITGSLSTPEADLASYPELEGRALKLRGEVAAAQMERSVLVHRRSLLQRERVPNLTVSGFAQRDGFAERVWGMGISVPIPLPSPVGRSNASEILEMSARIDSAGLTVEQVQRRIRTEVARADLDYRRRQLALGSIPPDLVSRAKTHLTALKEALIAKKLSMREAVAAQRSLVGLLQSQLELRLELALAWVELRRVTGMPFVDQQGDAK